MNVGPLLSRCWLSSSRRSSLPRCQVLVSYALVSLSLLQSVMGDSGAGQMLCNVASTRCVRSMGCSMALNNYYINCAYLISGESTASLKCSSMCMKALISLLSTEGGDGQALVTCDCDGNPYCQQQRERMQVCNDQVVVAMKSIYNNSTQIDCSLAELICEADTSCGTALHYYRRYCTKLFSGEKCTSRCNNSLVILHRQAKARKLRNCKCDGKNKWEMENCRELKVNTERMCLGHRHRHNHGSGRHHGHSDHNHSSTSGPVDPWEKNSRREDVDDQYRVQENTNSAADCGNVCIPGDFKPSPSSSTSAWMVL